MTRLAFPLTLGIALVGSLMTTPDGAEAVDSTPTRDPAVRRTAYRQTFRADRHSEAFGTACRSEDDFDATRSGRMFAEVVPRRTTLDRATPIPRRTTRATPLRSVSIHEPARRHTAPTASHADPKSFREYRSVFAEDAGGGVWRLGGRFDDRR